MRGAVYAVTIEDAGMWIGIATIGAIFIAFAAYVIYRFVRRFILDSPRRSVTVPAVFLERAVVKGKVPISDRGRHEMAATGGNNVVVENYFVAFRDGDGKVLKFFVDGETCRGLGNGCEGSLTYSGKRFMSFAVK